MNGIYRKAELTANVLIIFVAVLIAGFLAKKIFLTESAPTATTSSASSRSPAIGNKIALTDYDWSQSERNVLLVLSKGCRFCTESAEFYRRLIEQSHGKNVKITALLPQSKEEAEKYLNELNISEIEIRQSQLKSLDVGGTPTVIVADDKGNVSAFWIGKLSPEKEQEVINLLTS